MLRTHWPGEPCYRPGRSCCTRLSLNLYDGGFCGFSAGQRPLIPPRTNPGSLSVLWATPEHSARRHHRQAQGGGSLRPYGRCGVDWGFWGLYIVPRLLSQPRCLHIGLSRHPSRGGGSPFSSPEISPASIRLVTMAEDSLCLVVVASGTQRPPGAAADLPRSDPEG